MPNYQLTKIYYIKVGDEKYYGHSTEKYLSSRTNGHRGSFRAGVKSPVYVAARALGLTAEDLTCVFVENYPCNDINEARARERSHIEKDGTLNANLPGRTVAEGGKAWRESHKEYLHMKQQQWYADNIEHRRAYRRQYYLKNQEKAKAQTRANKLKLGKDDIAKYMKEYHEKNKEAIAAQAREYRQNETYKEHQKQYRIDNAEHINEVRHAWKEKNVEKVNAQARESYDRNKEKINARRRAARNK